VYLEASGVKSEPYHDTLLERVITMMTHSHYANDLSFAGSQVPLLSPPLNGYDTRDRLTIARSQVPEVGIKKRPAEYTRQVIVMDGSDRCSLIAIVPSEVPEVGR